MLYNLLGREDSSGFFNGCLAELAGHFVAKLDAYQAQLLLGKLIA